MLISRHFPVLQLIGGSDTTRIGRTASCPLRQNLQRLLRSSAEQRRQRRRKKGDLVAVSVVVFNASRYYLLSVQQQSRDGGKMSVDTKQLNLCCEAHVPSIKLIA